MLGMAPAATRHAMVLGQPYMSLCTPGKPQGCSTQWRTRCDIYVGPTASRQVQGAVRTSCKTCYFNNRGREQWERCLACLPPCLLISPTSRCLRSCFSIGVHCAGPTLH